jgi:hypothetical protein
MNNCVVYTITDPRDYLVKYVGITTNPKNRFCKHKSDKQKGEGIVKRNWLLNLHKLGLEPIFDIIDEGTVDYCIKAETGYIKLFMACGANLKNRAANGYLHKPSNETKEKISIANKGKKRTIEQIEELKKRPNLKHWLGKKFTQEHLKKMSENRKGITPKNKGIVKHDIELIKKIQSDYIPYVFGTIKLSKKYGIPTTTVERYVKMKL